MLEVRLKLEGEEECQRTKTGTFWKRCVGYTMIDPLYPIIVILGFEVHWNSE